MLTETRTALSLLDEILCTAVGIGLVLVTLLPGARGMSAVGWLPMWLVAMPAVAWWALHGFALPRRALRAVDAPVHVRLAHRAAPQARRATRPVQRVALRRAA